MTFIEIVPKTDTPKNRVKAKIMQKFYEQWISNQPGIEEDLLELTANIVSFNIKYGTKLDAEIIKPS